MITGSGNEPTVQSLTVATTFNWSMKAMTALIFGGKRTFMMDSSVKGKFKNLQNAVS